MRRSRPTHPSSHPRRPSRARPQSQQPTGRYHRSAPSQRRVRPKREEGLPDLRIPQSTILFGSGLALTAKLPALGEILTITRNAHAILAAYGVYPTLRARSDGLAAADEGGLLFADFTRWRDAVAREEPTDESNEVGGPESLFSLTFHDTAGDAFHRVCLLPVSDLARFHALVREHETKDGSRRRPAGAGHAGVGGEITAMQRSRLPALLARAAGVAHCGCGRPGCIDHVHPLKMPPAALPLILQRSANAALPLRVTLFQQAMVHTARLTPTPLAANGEMNAEESEWLFVHDERVGLHLRLAGIGALWFTLPDADSRGESCLEAYDARGELLAAFAPADPEISEAAWRSLVWFP